ncbi:MAG TPA: serpin family protein [Candidatus Limnocylindrales bacterium]
MRRIAAAPAALLLAVSVVSSACSQAGPSGGGDMELAAANVPRASADPSAAQAAAHAINAFGLVLLANAAAPNANVVVSPASVVLALAMARAGARGETAAQIDEVLRDVASDEHADWLNALDAALATRTATFKDANGDDQPVTLRIANAPFGQRGMTLEPAYLEALASRFGAGLRLVDYQAATEQARQAINGWVAGQTEQRIRELLAQGTLDAMTRLVLVNAIYLKAAWQTPFFPDATKPAPFRLADRSTVDVPTMHLSEGLPYAEGSGWRAVELPYVGGSLAMDVIVPDDMAGFERSLTGDSLAAVFDALAWSQVNLSMPKFSIETQAELSSILARLGMRDAFDSTKADFSGITHQEQLYISAVIHQANIDVDEKGTEAAAATAVVMRATGAPAQPVELTIDHPFLFALRDLPTGAVLFLGRVADPST